MHIIKHTYIINTHTVTNIQGRLSKEGRMKGQNEGAIVPPIMFGIAPSYIISHVTHVMQFCT